MKFIIKGPLKENPQNLMRALGYSFQKENGDRGEIAFTRPARGYPRFHLFLKIIGENLAFNIHLDQKKPSYGKFTAHSGEYNTEIIENEVQRIKQILEK